MKTKKIYVLHEYGANNHYNGLKELCKKHHIKLVFREFRFLHLIGSGIEHMKINRILKQPTNFLFMLSLLFSRDKIIVLGMHPYDWRLPILEFFLKNHHVFYHSSFTAWDPNEMEKNKNTSKSKLARIKDFIQNRVLHIFAVTQKTKESICSFTKVNESKVSVVYHSYTYPLTPDFFLPPTNRYIYVGRMDRQKGIEEICDYFSKHPFLDITFIGDGDYLPYIKEMSSKYDNIIFEGYIKGLKNLMPYYQKNAYFILNSKRTKEWEELFGQVLIEAMACGCVPISVNHSGPKEIISNKKDGFLFIEGDLNKTLDKISSLDKESYQELRLNAIATGKSYNADKIAKRWEPILFKSENLL